MSFNFPNSPTTNQLYPQPPIGGAPVWRWNGSSWVNVYGLQGTGGIYVSDTAPTGIPDGSLWWKSDVGQLYVYYNDGDSKQWVIASPTVNPSSYAAKTDVAPMDAMMWSGMQVNGNMEISQENGTSAVVFSGGLGKSVLDCWAAQNTGAQVVSCQLVYDAPPGYICSLKATVTTANTSPAAGDFFNFYNMIEGWRMTRLAMGTASASPVTIGFWAKANRTGLYSAAVRNGTTPYRSYPFTFTIATAGTWQYFTQVVPGDVSGSWTTSANTNAYGLLFFVSLMAGANWAAPAGAWYTGNYSGATGCVNGVAATTDYFQLTGVTILPGTPPLSAARAPYIMRSAIEELQICRRYYYKWLGVSGVVPRVFNQGAATATTTFSFPHPNEMRASPTMTIGWELNDVAQGSPPPNLLANSQLWGFVHTTVVASGWIDITSIIGDAR
jgi:hypothetical protein